jgi:hypothetical protein
MIRKISTQYYIFKDGFSRIFDLNKSFLNLPKPEIGNLLKIILLLIFVRKIEAFSSNGK